MRHQRAFGGFAMQEALLIFIILGIASIFVIPRFINDNAEAHAKVTQALGSSLKANAALAYSIYVEADNPKTIEMGGNNIAMIYGYPSSTPEGITRTIHTSAGFATEYSLYQVRYSVPGVINPETCHVVYTQSTMTGMPPSVVSETSDCT